MVWFQRTDTLIDIQKRQSCMHLSEITSHFYGENMVSKIVKIKYFVHRVMCSAHVDHGTEHMLGYNSAQ